MSPGLARKCLRSVLRSRPVNVPPMRDIPAEISAGWLRRRDVQPESLPGDLEASHLRLRNIALRWVPELVACRPDDPAPSQVPATTLGEHPELARRPRLEAGYQHRDVGAAPAALAVPDSGGKRARARMRHIND